MAACRRRALLYDARQEQILRLARLTAQRPSLKTLLADGDQAKLLDYLRTLQSGENVDLIVLCDPAGAGSRLYG